MIFFPINETILPAIELYFSDRESMIDAHGLIGTWNLRDVTVLDNAFNGRDMTGIRISDWNVSNVKSFVSTFEGTTNFVCSLNRWDMTGARSIDLMLANTSYNGSVDNWHVRHLVSANSFVMNNKTFNRSLRAWQTDALKFAAHMFDGAISYTGDYRLFNSARKLKDANHMFANSGVTRVHLVLQNIMNANHMFANARQLTVVKVNFGAYRLNDLQTARRMCMNAVRLTAIDFILSSPTPCEAHGIFQGASAYMGLPGSSMIIDHTSLERTRWTNPHHGNVYCAQIAAIYHLPWPPPRRVQIEEARVIVVQIAKAMTIEATHVMTAIKAYVGI